MDQNVLITSLLFGMVGMAMFMYGKRAARLVPLIAGVCLMVVPYFIPNLIALLIVCCLLMASPWVVREG